MHLPPLPSPLSPPGVTGILRSCECRACDIALSSDGQEVTSFPLNLDQNKPTICLDQPPDLVSRVFSSLVSREAGACHLLSYGLLSGIFDESPRALPSSLNVDILNDILNDKRRIGWCMINKPVGAKLLLHTGCHGTLELLAEAFPTPTRPRWSWASSLLGLVSRRRRSVSFPPALVTTSSSHAAASPTGTGGGHAEVGSSAVPSSRCGCRRARLG